MACAASDVTRRGTRRPEGRRTATPTGPTRPTTTGRVSRGGGPTPTPDSPTRPAVPSRATPFGPKPGGRGVTGRSPTTAAKVAVAPGRVTRSAVGRPRATALGGRVTSTAGASPVRSAGRPGATTSPRLATSRAGRVSHAATTPTRGSPGRRGRPRGDTFPTVGGPVPSPSGRGLGRPPVATGLS